MKGKKMSAERLAQLKAEIQAHRAQPTNYNKALTIDDLKAYKSEIIAEITKSVGFSEVKAVMTKMVELLPTTEITCEIELAKDAMCKLGYFDLASANLSDMNREAGRNLMAVR